MKVNICLSTYKGSRFLSEQIKSIQSQTFEDWTLLVRDDGSKDETVELIKAFEESDSRIRLINPQEQENIGFVASFFELVHREAADFYFFSDQDDVWLPNKLEVMLEVAKSHDKNSPALFYSNYKIVDESLNVLHEKMLRSPSTSLLDELTLNSVNGWASMMNQSLADLWKTSNQIDFHDWYLAELAAATGELIYIDEITGLYRQHRENIVGKNDEVAEKALAHRLEETWLLIENCRHRAKKVLQAGENHISSENEEVLKDFIALAHQKFWKRCRLVLKYKYRRADFLSSLKLQFLLVTNLGYKHGKR